jgi:hypothetical protein
MATFLSTIKKKKLLKIKLCKNGETTMREEGLLIG